MVYFIHATMKGKTLIRIKCHLNGNWQDYFEGMDISYEGEDTLLSGTIKDESHLHGILHQLSELNLKLISINPVENEKP